MKLFSVIAVLLILTGVSLSRGVYPVTFSATSSPLFSESLEFLALIVTATMASALMISWAIIRYENIESSRDHSDNSPQRFHSFDTPRIGGVAIFLATTLSLILLGQKDHGSDRDLYTRFVIAALPAFVGGLLEDLSLPLGVLQRLIMTMASGVAGVWLFGGVVDHLGAPLIDYYLQSSLLFCLVTTAIAVGGVANATNMIDGFNGLASGVTILIALAFTGIAFQLQDIFLVSLGLIITSGTAGFFIFNWPSGRIFLGDGGAYFLGFVIAELGILLVHRHPEVSPWCVLLILSHPVLEALHSIFRRFIHRNLNPGHPDRLHFHQIIFFRFLRGNLLTGYHPMSRQLARNSAVAPYFWIGNCVILVFVQFYFDSSWMCVLALLIGSTCYITLYNLAIRFNVPSFLLSHRRSTFLLRSARNIWEEQNDLSSFVAKNQENTPE